MIEETIQWFTPEEKLPEENDSILFIHSWGGMLSGYYKIFEGDDTRSFHSPQGSFFVSNIKCWAYLPKGPE